MIGNLQGWHLLIILAIVLLLFGAPKLPALARSVGQSMRIFRGEVKEMKSEKKSDDVVADGLSSDADAQDLNVTELKQKS
jgi:sec-independent protein translocase protein TatA